MDDNYEEDNVYQRSGAPFQPTQQTKDNKKEVEATLAQLPLLKEVVKRLDKRIAFYEKLESIQVDIEADPLTFQKVHAANLLTKQNLSAERSYIMARIERAR